MLSFTGLVSIFRSQSAEVTLGGLDAFHKIEDCARTIRLSLIPLEYALYIIPYPLSVPSAIQMQLEKMAKLAKKYDKHLQLAYTYQEKCAVYLKLIDKFASKYDRRTEPLSFFKYADVYHDLKNLRAMGGPGSLNHLIAVWMNQNLRYVPGNIQPISLVPFDLDKEKEEDRLLEMEFKSIEQFASSLRKSIVFLNLNHSEFEQSIADRVKEYDEALSKAKRFKDKSYARLRFIDDMRSYALDPLFKQIKTKNSIVETDEKYLECIGYEINEFAKTMNNHATGEIPQMMRQFSVLNDGTATFSRVSIFAQELLTDLEVMIRKHEVPEGLQKVHQNLDSAIEGYKDALEKAGLEPFALCDAHLNFIHDVLYEDVIGCEYIRQPIFMHGVSNNTAGTTQLKRRLFNYSPNYDKEYIDYSQNRCYLEYEKSYVICDDLGVKVRAFYKDIVALAGKEQGIGAVGLQRKIMNWVIKGDLDQIANVEMVPCRTHEERMGEIRRKQEGERERERIRAMASRYDAPPEEAPAPPQPQFTPFTLTNRQQAVCVVFDLMGCIIGAITAPSLDIDDAAGFFYILGLGGAFYLATFSFINRVQLTERANYYSSNIQMDNIDWTSWFVASLLGGMGGLAVSGFTVESAGLMNKDEGLTPEAVLYTMALIIVMTGLCKLLLNRAWDKVDARTEANRSAAQSGRRLGPV